MAISRRRRAICAGENGGLSVAGENQKKKKKRKNAVHEMAKTLRLQPR